MSIGGGGIVSLLSPLVGPFKTIRMCLSLCAKLTCHTYSDTVVIIEGNPKLAIERKSVYVEFGARGHMSNLVSTTVIMNYVSLYVFC